MKRIYRFTILIIFSLISITGLHAKAAIGYTYSHSGQPIYSSVGFSVTNDGIYTVQSDAWINDSGERLPANMFKSPEDLFIYTETVGTEKQDVIYVVDSASSFLFIFDGDLNYQKKLNAFEIKPENFTAEALEKVQTGKVEMASETEVKGITTRRFVDYLSSEKKMTMAQFLAVADIPYEERTDAQKFYLNPNGLSGVYRAIRPAKDERGHLSKEEFQDVIYLSDKLNNQIVIVDAKTYEVIQIITSPTDISFAGKVFSPIRVVTDSFGLMFIISEGVYEGIMQVDYDGNFRSYVGVNYITMSFWEAFQRRFMTDEQLRGEQATLNTIFTSIDIDHEQFLYTTSRAINDTDDTKMIKRINPSGNDVLTRNGYNVPKGDLSYIRTGTDMSVRGPSRFAAITVNDFGVYTVADEKTGRLFTYDDEGNLLYISGGRGNELNNLNNPSAIRYQGDNIIALDKARQAILRFVPTEIAKVINKATKYHYEGNLVAASEEWSNVVALNPNYEYAYVGIGKTLLNQERYTEAMDYFQIGYNVTYYSRAYKLARDEVIQKYFTTVVSIVLVVVVGSYSYKVFKRVKLKKAKDGEGDDND